LVKQNLVGSLAKFIHHSKQLVSNEIIHLEELLIPPWLTL